MTIESEPDQTQRPTDQNQVLAIVGVGLLGGSVALAAKARGIADRVIGIGRNPDRLQAAVAAGVIDEFLTELLTHWPVLTKQGSRPHVLTCSMAK